MNEITKQKDYSVDALIDFLNYAISKGLVNKNSGNARISAINKILKTHDLLTERERQNVCDINIESTFDKFHNKSPHELNPKSMKTYKSRLISAIDDFKEYNTDPCNFTPRRYVKNTSKDNTRYNDISDQKKTDPASIQARNDTFSLPIPIREGKIIIQITNIPFNLTNDEADKITHFIQGLTK